MVFEDITMDFIIGLPSSKGKATIMIVVDRLSKYGHFIPLAVTFSAQSVAEAFATGHFVGNEHCLPSPDGWTIRSVEQVCRAVPTLFRCRQSTYLGVALGRILVQYGLPDIGRNDTFPSFIWEGASNVAHYLLGSTTDELVEQYMLRRDEVLALLKHNLQKAQLKMKIMADKSRVEKHLEIGDWVYVKLQPYCQHSLRSQSPHKLGRRYFGPFKVLKQIGEVAYTLDLPEVARIHPVFHISMLKKCTGNPNQQITPLELTDFEYVTSQNLEDKVLNSVGVLL
nr:uncharacterized protein LOC104090486 [Nicotiana tomentosiformis]